MAEDGKGPCSSESFCCRRNCVGNQGGRAQRLLLLTSVGFALVYCVGVYTCVCVFALSATALAAEIVVFLFISSYSFLQVLLGCAVRLRIGLPLCPWEGGGVNWTPFCFCDQSTVFIQGEAV